MSAPAAPDARRPVRHFTPPATLSGRLWSWRYLLLRRATQLLVLLLFFGSFHWGWSVGGSAVLRGNLSASELLGLVPMADPFATLQILLTAHLLEPRVLLGATLVLAIYALVNGRAFCAWVCPLNMVTDLAAWLRRRIGLKSRFHLPRWVRYWVLAAALILSFLTGVAAFEWVSPIGLLHRELIFGVGAGWVAVAAVFAFDLLLVRDGWCGHLCPLGAFYALLGRTAQVRVAFDDATCTHCGDCAVICPEPQVLNLKRAARAGMVASGECTDCGRCIPICPEGSLKFDWRAHVSPHPPLPSPARRTT